VVDDDPNAREFVERCLSPVGYRVLEAEGGAQALDLLSTIDVDLVLLDILMPGMTGIQVLERRAQDPKLREIPFIVISAFNELDTVVQCIELGADDYLSKPYDLSILRARVGAAIERKQLRDRQTLHVETIERQAHLLELANVELRGLNAELESRVLARTAELEARSEELRTMTEQLVQAAKLAIMGELAASIAHELNNPLATVSLRLEQVLSDFAEEDAHRRSLEVVDAEVDRMARLVGRLLEFSSRGGQQASLLELGSEIAGSLEVVQAYLRSRSVNAVLDLGPGPLTVRADRSQLRQVLVCVFTNAADAMSDGGNLSVRVAVEDQSQEGMVSGDTRSSRRAIVIDITDTGTGIAPDILPHVLEPFFTTKPEGQRTGLGLAICRRVVHEHNGTLDITSEVGQGTRVRITLPATFPGEPISS